jgi:hypothetical protein
MNVLFNLNIQIRYDTNSQIEDSLSNFMGEQT